MGGKRLSAKDRDRLQEMVDYCTEGERCRRAVFKKVFGEAAPATGADAGAVKAGKKRSATGTGVGGRANGSGGGLEFQRLSCKMCDVCKPPPPDVVCLDGTAEHEYEQGAGGVRTTAQVRGVIVGSRAAAAAAVGASAAMRAGATFVTASVYRPQQGLRRPPTSAIGNTGSDIGGGAPAPAVGGSDGGFRRASSLI